MKGASHSRCSLLFLAATFEGVFAEGDGRREERGAEVLTFEESFHPDRLEGVIPLHLAQTAALAESTVPDGFKTRIEFDGTDADALGKGSFIERLKGRRKHDILQQFALHERPFFNHMDMIDKGDIPELLTIMEGAHADAEGRERNVDFFQRETSVQRFIADGVQSVRQVESVEMGTALESLLRQRIDPGRDDHFTQCGTTRERLFTKISEGSGQVDRFEGGTTGKDAIIDAAEMRREGDGLERAA